MAELRTSRLLLRPWREADLPAFAVLNADPEVRRWFLSTLTRKESDAQAMRIQEHIAAHQFGFWAVEVSGIASFVGFVGLKHVVFAAPFVPAVEVGWRLTRDHWGQGYATEAAWAALAHGFGPLGLAKIVAFTVPGNLPSRRVMERIGMQHDPGDDFNHPALPKGHPLQRHVLYRAKQDDWNSAHRKGGSALFDLGRHASSRATSRK